MTAKNKRNADTEFMGRCLELAQMGSGNTNPNPLVGCVVVHNGRIIGEGYHQACGGAHAEVNAIASVKDKLLLSESVLYVNLEPCNHHGRTPACTDLILSRGIPKVVIGCRDSHPMVSGSGIERLRSKGVAVVEGVLEREARFINRRFFTFHEKGRPYVILKWAKTRDGFMDVIRESDEKPGIHWITSGKLKALVHRWRHEEDAILVGAKTVINDDPELTTREWPGKNPVRIVVDQKGMLTQSSKVFSATAKILYFHGGNFRQQLVANGLSCHPLPEAIADTPDVVLRELHHQQLLSVIVEGGFETLQSFIRSGQWDEARVFTGNKHFSRGLSAPTIIGIPDEQVEIGDDLLEIFYNCKQML